MTALLDTNVLIALFDAAHVHHEAAHEWLQSNRSGGWATCPLTENGFIRVVANPSYPGRRTSIADAVQRLRVFRESGDHVFWPDSASLTDASSIDPRHIGGHQQITDVYLLSLAVRHNGRLATFDRTIRVAAVKGATSSHLECIT